MNTALLKYVTACLLLYTGILSIVVFWQTTNLLMGILTIIAAIGWLTWWYEHFILSDEAPSQAEALDAATVLASHSLLTVPKADAPQSEPEGAGMPVSSNQMAEQVRVALEEAEEAVSLSIQAFTDITVEAKEVAQCAREMMNWGNEKSPLLHSALAHLSSKSEHIGSNAQSVVTAFQFHDLLQQRLVRIAAYLDTVPDSCGDGQETAAATRGAAPARAKGHGLSLPAAAVSYAPKQDDKDDITLF